MTNDLGRFRVEPDSVVDLGAWDPDTDDGLDKKAIKHRHSACRIRTANQSR